MTVAELIKELKKMPKDAAVATEGCDCDGDAASVELITRSKEPVVYIRRSN